MNRGHLIATALASLTVGLGVGVKALAPTQTKLVPGPAVARCGIERWDVKTLTDLEAGKVRFRPVQSATVAKLGEIQPPTSEPTGRVAPVELTVYRVTATPTAAKIEEDGDVHLALRGGARTMIAEFPRLECVGNRQRAQMGRARSSLELACGPFSERYRTLTGRVTVIGVGFFDRIHGQWGVAPNGIELHPVTGFSGSCGA